MLVTVLSIAAALSIVPMKIGGLTSMLAAAPKYGGSAQLSQKRHIIIAGKVLSVFKLPLIYFSSHSNNWQDF